eukprot:scaffold2388_cov57-Cyclotella_meneghiniana.AAC.8
MEQGQVDDCADHTIKITAAGVSRCLIMDVSNDVTQMGSIISLVILHEQGQVSDCADHTIKITAAENGEHLTCHPAGTRFPQIA